LLRIGKKQPFLLAGASVTIMRLLPFAMRSQATHTAGAALQKLGFFYLKVFAYLPMPNKKECEKITKKGAKG